MGKVCEAGAAYSTSNKEYVLKKLPLALVLNNKRNDLPSRLKIEKQLLEQTLAKRKSI